MDRTLGPAFDLERPAAGYPAGALRRDLEPEEAAEYDRDMRCWRAFMDDPRQEASALMRGQG